MEYKIIIFYSKLALADENNNFVDFNAKNFQQSIDVCQKIIELEPAFYFAYNRIGLCYIQLEDEEQAKIFFDLPDDIKNKYEIDGLGGQRGYTSFGKEHAKGKKEGDLKEFWHFGQYREVEQELKHHYHPNVIVEEAPEFN